jgi:type IV secretion system protein TrbL
VVVLIAFFVLAVQLFVTLIEFKLSTLAGFVLVPFGLFGRTAFLAERVLGNVMASGVKVLVLAIIVGIGSTLFATFVQTFAGAQPDLEQVLATALAALCLLGLGIFGPGIASGLVSGAPQLGAGAAVGTAVTVGGLALAGAAGVRAAVGAAGAMRATAAGASAVRPGPTGSSPGGPTPPRPPGAPPAAPAGPGGSAAATGGPVPGGRLATAGSPPAPGDVDPDGKPAWARRMEAFQAVSHGVGLAVHAVGSGDHGGGSASVSLSEDK